MLLCWYELCVARERLIMILWTSRQELRSKERYIFVLIRPTVTIVIIIIIIIIIISSSSSSSSSSSRRSGIAE
jgi:hypothetical protein